MKIENAISQVHSCASSCPSVCRPSFSVMFDEKESPEKKQE